MSTAFAFPYSVVARLRSTEIAGKERVPPATKEGDLSLETLNLAGD